ncbi:MAG: beta-N-acetylhexosaminidase [Gammaproteobacteria bacterium]|nr:beta-N-acetylhexosaminidase [Gammaproteobacteria bacterium]
MTLGHVMLDLTSFELNQLEKELLRHPQVGGVILFTRNFESKKQLRYLIKDIRKINPECLIAVDQEGGRVQRFRDDFIPLPAFKSYGDLYEKNTSEAMTLAEKMAYAMACELLELGIDLSFTPVLDLAYGESEVIGDRSFHAHLDIVTRLGRVFIKGMHRAGMPATGKHFPGHGYVKADSHVTLPIDKRSLDTLWEQDMQPFRALNTQLDAVMPAHILYEDIDNHPPCFSRFWLQEMLRSKLNFSGVIFSDDLSMGGAHYIADYVQRAHSAFEAGCDMILICNHQDQAIRVLDEVELYQNPLSANRLHQFRKKEKLRGEICD